MLLGSVLGYLEESQTTITKRFYFLFLLIITLQTGCAQTTKIDIDTQKLDSYFAALEAADKDKFTFDQTGLVLEFDPAKNQMTLKQGGGVYLLSKE
ncbi:MAG: hypothetical protein AB8B69_19630 [Chitinophagales bacterium]